MDAFPQQSPFRFMLWVIWCLDRPVRRVELVGVFLRFSSGTGLAVGFLFCVGFEPGLSVLCVNFFFVLPVVQQQTGLCRFEKGYEVGPVTILFKCVLRTTCFRAAQARFKTLFTSGWDYVVGGGLRCWGLSFSLN